MVAPQQKRWKKGINADIPQREINWDEYCSLTKVLLDFWSLPDNSKEQILLMIDGLKFRRTQPEKPSEKKIEGI